MTVQLRVLGDAIAQYSARPSGSGNRLSRGRSAHPHFQANHSVSDALLADSLSRHACRRRNDSHQSLSVLGAWLSRLATLCSWPKQRRSPCLTSPCLAAPNHAVPHASSVNETTQTGVPPAPLETVNGLPLGDTPVCTGNKKPLTLVLAGQVHCSVQDGPIQGGAISKASSWEAVQPPAPYRWVGFHQCHE